MISGSFVCGSMSDDSRLSVVTLSALFQKVHRILELPTTISQTLSVSSSPTNALRNIHFFFFSSHVGTILCEHGRWMDVGGNPSRSWHQHPRH